MRLILPRRAQALLIALGALSVAGILIQPCAAVSEAANDRLPARGAADVSSCDGDLNGNKAVTIDELVAAVNSALNGCPSPSGRFLDNGDGTVTDTETALEWEKKVAIDGIPKAPDLHDGDNTYSWGGGENGIGSIFAWVGQLNEQQFAGHDDWRVPTVEELRNIVNCNYSPCIDPAFGPTVLDCTHPPECVSNPWYWSSTSNDNNPGAAFVVNFMDGSSEGDFSKGIASAVRAVRGSPPVEPTPCGTSPQVPVNEGSRESPVSVILNTSRCGSVATLGESFYLVTDLVPGSTHTVRISLVHGDARLRVFADTDFILELDCTLQAISPLECTLTTGSAIAFSVAAGPLERTGASYVIEVE